MALETVRGTGKAPRASARAYDGRSRACDCAGRRWRPWFAGMRCLATEVAHVPRQQVSKIDGDGEMLTGARIRATLTCREVDGEVRRRFVGGARGGVDAEGLRDSWAPWVDSWSSYDEAKGVREVGNPPAVRNQAAVKTHNR